MQHAYVAWHEKSGVVPPSRSTLVKKTAVSSTADWLLSRTCGASGKPKEPRTISFILGSSPLHFYFVRSHVWARGRIAGLMSIAVVPDNRIYLGSALMRSIDRIKTNDPRCKTYTNCRLWPFMITVGLGMLIRRIFVFFQFFRCDFRAWWLETWLLDHFLMCSVVDVLLSSAQVPQACVRLFQDLRGHCRFVHGSIWRPWTIFPDLSE